MESCDHRNKVLYFSFIFYHINLEKIPQFFIVEIGILWNTRRLLTFLSIFLGYILLTSSFQLKFYIWGPATCEFASVSASFFVSYVAVLWTVFPCFTSIKQLTQYISSSVCLWEYEGKPAGEGCLQNLLEVAHLHREFRLFCSVERICVFRVYITQNTNDGLFVYMKV